MKRVYLATIFALILAVIYGLNFNDVTISLVNKKDIATYVVLFTCFLVIQIVFIIAVFLQGEWNSSSLVLSK